MALLEWQVLWHIIGQLAFISTGVILVRREWRRIGAFDGGSSGTESKESWLLLATVLIAGGVWEATNSTFGTDYNTFHNFAVGFLVDPLGFYGRWSGLATYGPVSVVVAALVESLRSIAMPGLDWNWAWRVALVGFNVVSGLVVYSWFRGRRGLLALLLVLFNPFFAFYSTNNGLNDSIAVFFLLIGIRLAQQRSLNVDVVSGVSFGLAVLTKPYALFAVLPLSLSVLVWHRRNGLRIVATFLTTLAIVSSPFLISNSAAQNYLDAVIRYPLLISAYGHDLQSNLPNIGFAGIWSASRQLGFGSQAFYTLSTPAEIGIMLALLLALVLRRKELPETEVAFLGYVLFLVGTKYIWHNYVFLFVPLSLVVALMSLSKVKLLFVTGMLAVGEFYMLMDSYAYILGSYPPNYAFQDLSFFLVLGSYFVFDVYQLIKARPGPTGMLAQSSN